MYKLLSHCQEYWQSEIGLNWVKSTPLLLSWSVGQKHLWMLTESLQDADWVHDLVFVYSFVSFCLLCKKKIDQKQLNVLKVWGVACTTERNEM